MLVSFAPREAERFGWETEVARELLRWESLGATANLAICAVKMASAASNVGFSRTAFAAGVPVLDRDRLVDFPNDPVSGTVLLIREVGAPSVLELSAVSRGIDWKKPTWEITSRKASVRRLHQYRARHLGHCVESRAPFRVVLNVVCVRMPAEYVGKGRQKSI